MHDNLARVIDVNIDEILPNRFQPRVQFDEEEILELSDSIKEHGVIQPIVVRTIGDKYEIIAGERRYKASVLAGKETIPVIIKNLDDKQSAEIALIENVQRKNLTPIEEALSYKKILDMGYLTQEGLAEKIGKSQSSVANKIRLLNLSDEVQEALLQTKISERHARSLLKLSSTREQNEMLDRIIKERLTVRRTDEEIEKLKNPDTSSKNLEGDQEEIKRGEENMNNNMFTNQPQQSVPSFDIFGPSTPQQPVQAPVEVQPQQSVPSFDIFGPSTPQQPVQAPVEVQPQQSIPSFDIFESSTPQQPILPSIPSAEIDAQASVSSTSTFELPSMPTTQAGTPQSIEQTQLVTPAIPEMQPIIETPITQNPVPEPTFELPTLEVPVQTEEVEQPAIQNSVPEPIIVTDYSKQYDPVMPTINQEPQPTVDFKEVINAIRECSDKIEKYGFKIDVEEYDLANLYQVIFKIEK